MIYNWRQIIFILGFYKRKPDVWASTSEILFQTTFPPPPACLHPGLRITCWELLSPPLFWASPCSASWPSPAPRAKSFPIGGTAAHSSDSKVPWLWVEAGSSLFTNAGPVLLSLRPSEDPVLPYCENQPCWHPLQAQPHLYSTSSCFPWAWSGLSLFRAVCL